MKRVARMRKAIAALMSALLMLAGCDGNGSAQGGGDTRDANARAKINMPF